MVCLDSYLPQEAAVLSPSSARKLNSFTPNSSVKTKLQVHTHIMASHTHTHVHIKWEMKTKTRTETHTRTHSHTLEPSGSAMETMHAAEGIETVSLCESCNLLTEGRILCWARERASNTASFPMPSGCVVRACVCLRACVRADKDCERVREKEADRVTEAEGFIFGEMMMNRQRNAVACMSRQGETQGGQKNRGVWRGLRYSDRPHRHVERTLWHVFTSPALPADPACLLKSNLPSVWS